MAEERKIFVRPVSGLVRELSLTDACLYGILATGTFLTLAYFWPFGMGVLPGTSLPLLGVYGLIFGMAMSLVYAGLGSAMPRSGGDYIYQSRILHPSLGFAISFGFFAATWVVTGVYGGMVVSQFLQTILLFCGHLYDNPMYIEWGNWWLTPTALFIINTILVTVAAINAAAGMKWYRRVQKYVLIPMIFASHVVIVLLLAMATPSAFQQAFNSWTLKMTGQANSYSTIIKVARDAGYATPTINPYHTLIFFALPGTWLLYTVFSAQGILGEVKGARSFSKLFQAFYLGVIYSSAAVTILIAWLFENVVGWDFLNAFAFAYYSGLVKVPYIPSYIPLVTMLTTNPILMILIGIATLSTAYYMMICCFLNATRIWLAQSLDGVLPEWFVKVSKRFHAPINAIFAHWVFAMIWATLFSFWSEFYWWVYSGVTFCWIAGIVPTAIAAIIFPWARKELYRASPISKNHPLIVIAGIALLVITAHMSWSIWFEPALGSAWFIPRAVTAILFVGSLAWFWLYRAYQKRRGINIDLAYKEIPPE